MVSVRNQGVSGAKRARDAKLMPGRQSWAVGGGRGARAGGVGRPVPTAVVNRSDGNLDRDRHFVVRGDPGVGAEAADGDVGRAGAAIEGVVAVSAEQAVGPVVPVQEIVPEAA